MREREASAPPFLICTGIAGKGGQRRAGVGKSGDIIIRSIPFHSFVTPSPLFLLFIACFPHLFFFKTHLSHSWSAANKCLFFYGLYLVSRAVCFIIITRLASLVYAIFYCLNCSFAATASFAPSFTLPTTYISQ